MKNRVLAVVGPTASGKTALAVEIAGRVGGEIVSCDSMQVYRGMDIGTAKPSADEQRGVVHHLIDVVEPDVNFSAADYALLAGAAADDIISRGKIPVFCGGTGLYLDAVLTANCYSEGETDFALRSSLLDEAGRFGSLCLWEQLRVADPDSAAAIHPNNVKRVARALEIYLTTGVTKTEWDSRSRLSPSPYDTVIIAPEWERSELYARIDLRADMMISAGLVGEVEGLLSSGRLPRNSTAAQAIGYKEIIAYLDGFCTLSEAVSDIKQASRRYAKRQLTWFRRNNTVNWLNMECNFEVIVNNAIKLLTNEIFCDIIIE